MIELLKKILIQVKFYSNEIEIKRLDTNIVIKRQAQFKFSTDRLIISDFNNAEILLSQLTKEITGNRSLSFNKIVMIIQQMIEFPDGISEIEKRAYRDLAEHAGAIQAIVLNDTYEITKTRLKEILKNN